MVCAFRLTKRASISDVFASGSGIRKHARDQERPTAEIFDDLETRLALADEMVGAVGRGDVAHDIGDRAHAMHVDRGWIVHIG